MCCFFIVFFNSPPPSEESLPKNFSEKAIVRDINYPGYDIRRYRTFKIFSAAQAAKKKKHDRVCDNYHACLICGKLRQHINVHAKTHATDPRVIEIMKMKKR